MYTGETSDEIEVIGFQPIYQREMIDLILHIQNVEHEVGISLEEQRDLLDIEGCYTTSGGGFWLALTRGEKVVGTLGLHRKTETVGILKKFFVHADYRGQGKKTASKLFDTLLSFSTRQCLSMILLDTPSVATRSHAFYKRNGFTEISPTDLPVEYDYADRNSLLFRLDLKSAS